MGALGDGLFVVSSAGLLYVQKGWYKYISLLRALTGYFENGRLYVFKADNIVSG